MRYTKNRKTFRCAMLTALLLWIGAVSASAAPPAVGEPAPPFRFVGVEGLAYEGADFFSPIPISQERGAEATAESVPGEASNRGGRAVVIAWFPKAFTPG